jgi:hypothetical protein
MLGIHNILTEQTHSNLDAMYELSELKAARNRPPEDIPEGLDDDGESVQGSAAGAGAGANSLGSESLLTDIKEVVQQSIDIIAQYQLDKHACAIDEAVDEAHALRNEGCKYREAEDKYREAVELAALYFGEQHPCYAVQLCNLARYRNRLPSTSILTSLCLLCYIIYKLLIYVRSSCRLKLV